MKALTSPIAILDGSALPLDADAAESEQAAPGEGFDALLALVNAQATKGPQPVKALAPSVGLQSAPNETGKGSELKGAEVAKGALLIKRDVAQAQVFLPWRGVQLPEADGATKPDTGAEGVVEATAVAPAANPALPVPVPALPAANPALPVQVQVPVEQPAVTVPTQRANANEPMPPSAARAAPQIGAKDVNRGAALRKASGRERDDAQSTQDATLRAPSAQGSELIAAAALAASAVQPAPSAPAPHTHSQAAPAVVAPQLASPNSSGGSSLETASDLAPPVAGFENLLSTQVDDPSAPSQPAQMSIPMSDKETGAVVTRLEFYESSPSIEPKEAVPVEANAEPAHEEAAREDSANLAGEAESESSANREREPGREPVPVAPQATFAITEGKGMRGLDAVVASLLRPYQEKSESKSGTRVATVSAPHISVETGKSQTTKVEERVLNVTTALDSAALKREEEERRGELRELVDPAVPHFAQHLDAPAPAAAPADAAPPATASPVNVPAPLPDPDAAMMGKLARGESLNAAVSIEHPELGTMDLVVQNENGRIDVRATLDTPRAAAVLRAHESALRYGVQQAGMRFGALRVNARTGETKIERSRDALKRRRDRDWEA